MTTPVMRDSITGRFILSSFPSCRNGHLKTVETIMLRADGRHVCLPCQREAGRRRHNQHGKAEKQLRRNMNFYQAIEYLGGRCVDCGYFCDLRGLEFDHVDGRDEAPCISSILHYYAWDAIEIELDKCDLVCGTCHRIRTADRRQQAVGGRPRV